MSHTNVLSKRSYDHKTTQVSFRNHVNTLVASRLLTSDPWLLETVSGYHLEFG